MIAKQATTIKLDLELVVMKYRGALTAYLTKFLGDRYVAEDIAQDTFLKLARRSLVFENEQGLSAWLYKVARNAATDFHRRQRQQNTVFVEDLEVPCAETETGNLENTERRNKVASAVRKLSDRHREALLMRVVEKRPYREIGDALDCSIGGVRSMLATAKRILRKHLAHHNAEAALNALM